MRIFSLLTFDDFSPNPKRLICELRSNRGGVLEAVVRAETISLVAHFVDLSS